MSLAIKACLKSRRNLGSGILCASSTSKRVGNLSPGQLIFVSAIFFCSMDDDDSGVGGNEALFAKALSSRAYSDRRAHLNFGNFGYGQHRRSTRVYSVLPLSRLNPFTG